MKKNISTIGFLYLCISINVYSQNYPSGFSQVQVTSGINNPTVFDFAPDGRIFAAQQDGALRVIKNGVLLSTPAIDLEVDANGERGLTGIAVHPDFSVNHYVYLYYTTASGTKRNKISRFTFSGDLIDPASETVILELDPLNNSNIHNSGAMKFSQDGKLFISVGDNNNSANAQNADTYLGKILRINPDGSAPANNPFITGASPQSKRVWAMGLRNPFTFDIHPLSGKIFVNEVGHALWEEINDATEPGVNFGWPYDQGIVEGTTFTNPVFAYAHDGQQVTGCAITGGAFFNPPSSNYPASYIGKYFFMDYCSNFIRYLDPEQNSSVSSPFASFIPSTSLSIKTGPDGNLYFLSRSSGSLYKIVYTQNDQPVISEQPHDLTLAVSQNASFIVSVSGTPPFFYQWKKNSVAIPGATSPELKILNISLADSGKYSVSVNNASGTVVSTEAVLRVVETKAPVATISSPANGTLYKAGDLIHFSGNGTDEEDGLLPASAFSWKVEFWHGTGTHAHVHDGPPIAEGVKNGSFTIPSNNETATDVFYRLILTVKDSDGISDTESVDIFPKKSILSLATEPEGFRLLLDGQPRNTFFTFESVEGIERSLGIISPQSLNGNTYKFDRWLHGGDATQIISTPEKDVTYTAVFKLDTDLRDPDNPINAVSGIHYDYYEGSWLLLPDFSTLSPVENGTVSTFTLSPKNREQNFAFQFTGYINIDQDGLYTFYTSSNDGSKLYIGDRLVVNNDGQHPSIEVGATIGLKAGKHAITVTHFQYNGTSDLRVSYSADHLFKQEIPSSKLFYQEEGSVNNAPSVSITSPTNNQQFPDLSTISISSEATDSDGSIAKVEFFQANIKLGEDTVAPFQYIWSNVPNGNYSLTAKAYDNQGASKLSTVVNIKVGSSIPVCSSQGIIEREYWTGINGIAISSIPFNTTPTETEQLNTFDAPQNWDNNYGSRIRGYLCAPATGYYYFWIASNDEGELWLSNNENPAGKQKIAYVSGFSNYQQWEKMGSQKSLAIWLVAGNRYYIEALQKEGVNSDHLSVGWQLPDATLERPIPGSRLSPFNSSGNMLPSVNITNPLDDQQFASSASVTITADAMDSDGSISKVEFYQGVIKLGEDTTAPYQYSWNAIPDGRYSITAKAFDDQNASTLSSAVTIMVGDPLPVCSASGTILREYWTGIQGESVSSIPLHITPNGSEQISVFEGPQNWNNHYASRIRGYICAPVTGEYYFWIASNDQGELWMSTDQDPLNKVKIAEVTSYTNYRQWTKFPEQRSAAINLQKGHTYYIEALQKEGVNSDHISVGWQLPDGTLERPVPGARLSPYLPVQARLAEPVYLSSEIQEDSSCSILVYPNPAERGYITLGILGYKGKEKADIRILDSNGKEVYSQKASCDKTCARTLIHIDERFVSGVYTVHVEIEKKYYHTRLLIK